MITIDGEKQKGRVITITNYHEYAQKWTIHPHMKPHKQPHMMPHMMKPVMARLLVHMPHMKAHMKPHKQPHIMNKKVLTRI